MKYIILSSKPWNAELHQRLGQRMPGEWILINDRADFTAEKLRDLGPAKVFIPHWSHLIPEAIFSPFECIVFHMTDLPYGRGGSPLQNLIARGHKSTQISAIRVEAGLDTGPVYMKAPLDLSGTAEEIFFKADRVIEEMIVSIIENDPTPQPQEGEPEVFRRRTPDMSDMTSIDDPEKLYDHIRMLDAEGYPHAFLETEHFRLEFTRASLDADQSLSSHVRIVKK